MIILIRWKSTTQQCRETKTVPHNLVRRIRSCRIKSPDHDFAYSYWTISQILFWNQFTSRWTQMIDWVGRTYLSALLSSTECVAVCCSVLQCVAVRCSVLQWKSSTDFHWTPKNQNHSYLAIQMQIRPILQFSNLNLRLTFPTGVLCAPKSRTDLDWKQKSQIPWYLAIQMQIGPFFHVFNLDLSLNFRRNLS